MADAPDKAMAEGRVVAARGGIVDVVFPDVSPGDGPHIDDLLYAGDVALQVMSFVEGGAARCIALASARGIGLGAVVRATGGPVMAPVGEAVLGRMLDVFGAPIDGLPPPVAERTPVDPPGAAAPVRPGDARRSA